MGEAPRDLNGSRGTTMLGDPGWYSFGEDAGQQGMGLGLGFTLPEYGNQGFTQAAASGTAETGVPNLWASQATGTGMTGLGFTQLAPGNLGIGAHSAAGALASGGPGQWACPTTGTGISGISFTQPGPGNQGGGQAIASRATATGGLVQGVSPGNQGGGSSHRIRSNRNGRPGARGRLHNGHGNQCGGGTRPRG